MLSNHRFAVRSAVVAGFMATSLCAQIGTIIGSFPTPSGVVPVGLGNDASGSLLMTGIGTGRTIVALSSTGVETSRFTPTNSDTPVDVTTDGVFLYVVDQSANTGGPDVDVYTLNGTYQRSFSVQPRFPEGIAYVAASSHLFIVNSGAAQVLEYDTQGALLNTFALQGSSNSGIAHNPVANEFWVLDRGGDLLRRYDATFTELSNFPGPVAGGFTVGRGLAFNNGALFCVATGSRIVLIYDTTGQSAASRTYGNGCPVEPVVYELFAPGTMDVANRSFQFTPNGTGGWSVTNCATNCFDNNIGPNRNMGDDQLDTNIALGFAFPMAGSINPPTTAIDISSNGFIYLRTGGSLAHGCCDANVGLFLNSPERISALWMDLDPSVGGGVHFNALPGKALITWMNVREWNTGSANTAQIQLFPSGAFIITYQAAANLNHTTMTGYSPGNSGRDPGSTDLSTAVPFNTGFGGPRLSLSTSRPSLNTNLVYQASSIPSTAVLAVVLLGSAQANTPLDPLGMTGCSLLTSADLAQAPLSLPAGTFSLLIPNQPALAGALLYNQAVIVAAGTNPFGAVTSNGIELTIGF
ncbi:MAG: YncE family protein [Planctomycetota bacterium]